jgi:putative transposase
VPPTLARTLRSTNVVESMIEICQDHAANVKRWESGTIQAVPELPLAAY